MKLKNPSLKLKLFAYIAFFSIVMVFVIWLFQIVLLDFFYKQTKVDELHSLSDTIVENIDNQDLTALVTEIAGRNGICAKVIGINGGMEINVDTVPNCVLHRMNETELSGLYTAAENSGGSVLEVFKTSPRRFLNIKEPDGSSSIVAQNQEAQEENIIYTKLITENDGNNYILMLNTVVSPVNATVQTLRSQLFYISVIFLVLALFLALILSKRISDPIVRINEGAKRLGKGEMNIHFDGVGYKEITELSETLNYASEELSKVENLRRELIANISHDLRTPLTMITGYAEVMRDLPGENTPENLQVIIDEANRLTTLVNDVLDISKLQSGVQTIKRERFNLTACIRQILTRYSKLVEQEGYQILFIADEDLYVEGDVVKLTQVIYNLINNAINYAGEDRIVTVRQEKVEDRQIKIEIVDHGEGISEEMRPYVWDRYYKGDKTHKRASIGTGLGLSIVKNILELHHLEYGVDSIPGEGSDFWFIIPESPEAEEKDGQ